MTDTSQPIDGELKTETKPNIAEMLEATNISPEQVYEKCEVAIDGFELANGYKISIQMRRDKKDGFVVDDKRQSEGVLEIFTPAAGNNGRPLLKQNDWENDPGAKSPRDVLHPVIGTILTLTRKSHYNRQGNFVQQTEEGRAAKRPATEAIITAITDSQIDAEIYQASLNTAYEQYKQFVGGDFTEQELLDNFTGIINVTQKIVKQPIGQ